MQDRKRDKRFEERLTKSEDAVEERRKWQGTILAQTVLRLTSYVLRLTSDMYLKNNGT